jgi:UDP-2,3-diacylglucosamine pyrophosphatase LpxH
MKYIESSYEGSADTLNVLLLNDLHIGAKSANIDLLKKCIKFALDNQENTRILLNGDYIEGVLIESKGDIYEQTMSPKEQADYVVELLYPVRHLIDGITSGNHDFRVEKATSFDPVEIIAKDLGIKNKYLGTRGIVGFSINKMYYSVELHHGVGGGSTIAAVENAMKKLWKSDSDVMYCGHWHKEFFKIIKRFSINKRYKKMIEEKKIMICGNTIVDTAEYAKRGGYEESFPSQALLICNGILSKGKNIDVSWIRQ